MTRLLTTLTLAIVAAIPTAHALAEKAGPSTAPSDVGKVTVVSVTGKAHKLVTGNGRKWEPLKAGEVLDELTVIRTGFRTTVILKFEDRSVVRVNNGTKMGIGEFRKKPDSTKIRLGLKYGTIRAAVDSSKGPHEFSVTTPVATLSVRGSLKEVGYSVDGGARGISYKGQLHIKTPAGVQRLDPGQSGTQKKKLPILSKMSGFLAMVAPSSGLSKHEMLLAMLNSTGAASGQGGFVPTNKGAGNKRLSTAGHISRLYSQGQSQEVDEIPDNIDWSEVPPHLRPQ